MTALFLRKLFLSKTSIAVYVLIALIGSGYALSSYIAGLKADQVAAENRGDRLEKQLAQSQQVAAEQEAQAARLREQLEADRQLANNARETRLVREGAVKILTNEVYRDRTVEVPKECEPVLAPINRALDGLREQRSSAADGD